jgi:hypothetical protein
MWWQKTTVVALTPVGAWIVAQLDGTAALDWGNLPAWGVVALGFAALLKFVVKDLSSDLKEIKAKLDVLITLQTRQEGRDEAERSPSRLPD